MSMAMHREIETVIGLEVHVQLATCSKIFCASSARFGAEPNELVDPLTLGLPGSLPVLNRRVVECAIMLGLAMGCEIRRFNRFARKHYFYPDLPKGYQISQFEEPVCERGHIDISTDSLTRSIGIKRIHMEEDAGKNIHDQRTHASLLDLNRAGVPLLEIVSDPDLRSPAEAAAYMRAIRQLVRYLEIGDGNMEEGSLRCDANISLRPAGSSKLGTRTEIKNINSFRFVEKALEYEIARQRALLEAGKEVVQETLGFDSLAGVTRPMRGKEESSDYRYFPDPDLPPLVIEESWIREIYGRMPRLPGACEKQLIEVYGLSPYDARVISAEKSCFEYFEKVFNVCSNAKLASNWITSELFGALKKAELEIEQSPISPFHLGTIIKLVEEEVINGKMAKSVFDQAFRTGENPEEIIARKGLKQITGDEQIMKVIAQAFESNPSQLKAFLAGDDRLHGYFVGQVMKLSGGSANPKKVNDLLRREISRLRSES